MLKPSRIKGHHTNPEHPLYDKRVTPLVTANKLVVTLNDRPLDFHGLVSFDAVNGFIKRIATEEETNALVKLGRIKQPEHGTIIRVKGTVRVYEVS